MPTITLDDTLWSEFAQAARQVQRDPEALAADALWEYLGRMDDERLLEQSAREAQASRFGIEDTEAVIRAHREHSQGAG